MGLSFAQLEQLWTSVGGNPSAAPVAAAVALAESGGNVGSVNPNDPGGSYGLWQINGASHPQYDPTQLATNPAYNAAAAVQVSNNGTDFRPWTTYTNGAYLQYLGSAGTGGAYTAGFPGAAGSGGKTPASSGQSATSRGFALRIVEVLGGVTLALVGLALLGLTFVAPVANPVLAATGLGSVSGAVRRASGSRQRTQRAASSEATAQRRSTATEARQRRGEQYRSQLRREEAEHRQGLRMTEREHTANARRYGRGAGSRSEDIYGEPF